MAKNTRYSVDIENRGKMKNGKHKKSSTTNRSSYPDVLLVKGVLKICNQFTGEHPCRSVISIKLQSNFIEMTLRHGCSPVNFLHIFRTPFTKNTSERLLLILISEDCVKQESEAIATTKALYGVKIAQFAYIIIY